MIHYPTNQVPSKSYAVSANSIFTHAVVKLNEEEHVLLDHHEVLHMIDLLKDAYTKIAPPTKMWIGVDLDGTLAQYFHGDIHRNGQTYIGSPIPRMVDQVKQWLAEGRTVKIFTARIAGKSGEENDLIRETIQQWCDRNIGQILEITNVKDRNMEVLYDDRAVGIVPNTGMTPLDHYRNL